MRITRLFVLLGLAALLAPRIEASRTSVWGSNPPASLTATRADAAGLLASLAPAAAADADLPESPPFNLGDVILVDTADADAERFDLGPLTLVDLNLLRGPPPSYPETRVGGFELLPPFRIGASASLSLWGRQACGFSCRGVVSDSRYDPWGLKAECPVGYWLQGGRCVNDGDEVPVIDRELEFADRALHTKDPCYPIPCLWPVTPDERIAKNFEKQASRERLLAAREELEEGLGHWAEGPQLPAIVGGPKAPSRTVRARPSRAGTPRRGVNLVKPKVQPGPTFRRNPYQTRYSPVSPGRPDPLWSIDTRNFRGGVPTEKGGVRDQSQFWKEWLAKHPGTLSDRNRMLIEKYGVVPEVDAQWTKFFPEHAAYMKDRLFHHHVDQGPFAVPVPESTHPGSGGPFHAK